MRVVAAGAAFALLINLMLPARAQDKPLTGPEELAQKRQEEAAEVEKAYQRTLKSTGSNAASAKADPWGSVRASDPIPAKQNPRSQNLK